MKRFIYILLLVIALTGCAGKHVQAQPIADYSYSAYYRMLESHRGHMSQGPSDKLDGPCSLLTQEEGGKILHNQYGYYIACNETGKAPTNQQINIWESYVLWHACNASKDQYACDALRN